ncbi:unnamed protein product [Ilex paraguariensis]|uniref:NERD domain-containing protein n=1 Tax=Ilex paraguariensis TaxID=185542 RepID=A0ABC8QP96_9AQUA
MESIPATGWVNNSWRWEPSSLDECEDLRRKVKGGLVKKPTVVELEQKARSLHEDITKHWIARELALLEKLIDRANEKGWRRELFEYMERKQLLQTSSEQSRLLQSVPIVIPDVAELETIAEDIIEDKNGDETLPKLFLTGSSEIPSAELEGKRIASGGHQIGTEGRQSMVRDTHSRLSAKKTLKNENSSLDFLGLKCFVFTFFVIILEFTKTSLSPTPIDKPLTS